MIGLPSVLGHHLRALVGRTRTLPDYLILGAQKAGTTSLQRDLEGHPDVQPAAVKEVHYFDLQYARGEAWYRSHFPSLRNRSKAARDGRPWIVGDATPYYLFHPEVPARARKVLPEARLIVVLRDPVERAHSHHHHETRFGVEDASFEEALDREAARLEGQAERLHDPTVSSRSHQHHSYVARGLYARQLRAWWEHYPVEQTLVLTTDEMSSEPEATFDRVLDFLGLAPWTPPAFAHLNASGRPPLEPAIRARLERVLEPHNRELEELLGRPLGW